MSRLETRANIIKQSRKLFAAKGFQGVRTKEIAEAAEISEVTLFKYFSSKEDLYDAVLSEASVKLDPAKILAGLNRNNLQEDLELIARFTIDNLFKNQDVILMKQKEGDTCKRKHKRIEDDPVYKCVFTLMNEYMDKGEIRVEPLRASKAFTGNLAGQCRLAIDDNVPKQEIMNMVNGFIDIFVNGVRKQERYND